MPIIKQSETSFEPVPAGTHIARCYAMVSLGTQLPTNPQYKPSFKVVLQFEFPNERIEVNGVSKPMMTGQFLSAYLGSVKKPSKTNLFLTAWRGKAFTEAELAGFDVSRVVGAPCMLNMIHETKNGKLRETIASISPLPKGTVASPQINPKLVYEIEQGRDKVFQALPEWMQKMISGCEEWTHPAISEPEPEPADQDGANVESEDVAF